MASQYHHQPHNQNQTPTSPTRPPPSKPNARVLSLLLKVIIMTLLTSLFFLFLGLASATLLLLHLCVSSHRQRQRHRLPPLPSTPSSGLLPGDLDILPHFRLKLLNPTNGAVQEEECVVCLDIFRDGQCCRKLAACGHMFHKRCVDSWLVKVAACPICRARVQLDAEAKGSMVGSEEDEDKQLRGVW
ncbi:RING-H2 finger protein ATL56 [Morella rubra]|uniref:RING-H2 finger protein ATL56 n=1 Tax=Morella rubra TaxID=262757 RepID=A0A6A1UUP0_9ROSI|nr:RING-H2 finger protein ATL56 [Morella rubra]